MFKALIFLFNARDWFRFFLLLLLMLIGSGIELITLSAVPLYVSALLRQNDIPGSQYLSWCFQAFPNASLEQIATWGGLLLMFLFAIRTLVLVLNNFLQQHILKNRQIELSSRLFKAVMNSPYTLLRTRNSSSVINTITGEVDRLINAVLSTLLYFIRNTFVFIAVLSLIFWYAPLIALISFGSLGIVGCALLFTLNHWIKKLGEISFHSRQAAAKAVSEGVGVFKEATILGVKPFFLAALHQAVEKQATASRQADSIQKSLWPMMELVTVVILLGTMGLMMLLGRNFNTLLPSFALLAACLARIKGCVTELMVFHSTLHFNSSVVCEISSELQTLENAALPPPPLSAPPCHLNQTLEIEKLTFQYADAATPLLKEISLTIPRGSSVAFVGPTGTGKTTMTALILGLLSANSGTIKADGIPITDNLPSWQSHIGFVPQDIYILDDTIRANIALGVNEEEIDETALQKAIQAASLSQFIESLPNGLNTILGERGTRISGGQRQRIGIARALYRAPELLIFDEATSALDNATESSVVEAISNLKGSHTLLIVAHRLTTIQDCNYIYYFSPEGVTLFHSLKELEAQHTELKRK